MYDDDRAQQLAFIAPRIRHGGILVQVQKLANEDQHAYDERERQKDELFKSRYFTLSQISEKKAEILGTMANCQVDLKTTVSALRLFFRYCALTWNSGNFYTIVSSNSRASILEFVSLMVKPAIPPAYCYEKTPNCAYRYGIGPTRRGSLVAQGQDDDGARSKTTSGVMK